MIYLAGPLFTEAEQQWLRALSQQLAQRGHEVCWPYDLFREGEIVAFGPGAPRRIMERCRDALRGCDRVVAWIDGAQVDDGTAWELGYAYALGKPILGLRTDFRQAGDTKHSTVNAMVEGCCARILRSVPELLAALE